ncbi:MAG TPA: class I SAM-dependent methyltransferase [Candidatus Limnocylindria bacterium]|nr:class I SAM-dependent methyltransferase [Candidatus Limnocylindria bacterium]
MDETARFNRERWRQLAEANAVFTRPALDLDADTARRRLDPGARLGPLAGRMVLVLAGGGGQQSLACALLGASVVVLDLSAAQLARDREAAAYHGLEVRTIEGDMRDLSVFDAAAFDVVWQPYSLNFVPDRRAVFREVARVIRPGGLYHVQLANPYFVGVDERDFDGEGYVVKQPYLQGALVETPTAAWVADGRPVPPAREFRQTLETVINGLVESGFRITHLDEGADTRPDPRATPGSWDHFNAVVPPWLSFWTVREP